MESSPCSMIVDHRSMVLLDSVLADMADALEFGAEALEVGVSLSPATLELLKGLACRARALVLLEMDAGVPAYKALEDGVTKLEQQVNRLLS